MANYTAFLGVMLPAYAPTHGVIGAPVGGDPALAWPLVDYATAPGYTQSPYSGRKSFDGVTFYGDDRPVISQQGLYVYAATDGHFLPEWVYSWDQTLSYDTWSSEDLLVDYIAGGEWYGELKPQTVAHITLDGTARTRAAGVGVVYPAAGNRASYTAYEVAVFDDISLPYNPDLSSYSLIPVIPSGAKADYTALNGKRQVINYAAPVYQIAMTYTWTGSKYADRLRDGLKKAITDGTPLLFCEPWSGDSVASRGVHLLNLDSAPSITMTSANTYTCTITGTTQP